MLPNPTMLPVTNRTVLNNGYQIKRFTPLLGDPKKPGFVASVYLNNEHVGFARKECGNYTPLKLVDWSPMDENALISWTKINIIKGHLARNETLLGALIDEFELTNIVNYYRKQGYILGKIVSDYRGVKLTLLTLNGEPLIMQPATVDDVPHEVCVAARKASARVWGADGWIFV